MIEVVNQGCRLGINRVFVDDIHVRKRLEVVRREDHVVGDRITQNQREGQVQHSRVAITTGTPRNTAGK